MTPELKRARRIYNSVTKSAQNRALNKKDIAKLLEASELGFRSADYALSFCFKDGLGVSMNAKKSFQYMKKAADNDIKHACFNTAVNYESGYGITINLKMAFYYYYKGALTGDSECIFECYRCFFHGIGTDKRKDIAKIFKKYMFTLNTPTRKT